MKSERPYNLLTDIKCTSSDVIFLDLLHRPGEAVIAPLITSLTLGYTLEVWRRNENGVVFVPELGRPYYLYIHYF